MSFPNARVTCAFSTKAFEVGGDRSDACITHSVQFGKMVRPPVYLGYSLRLGHSLPRTTDLGVKLVRTSYHPLVPARMVTWLSGMGALYRTRKLDLIPA